MNLLISDVKTPADMLLFMVDSVLSGVLDMSKQHIRNEQRYKKQIALAQHGMDKLKEFEIPLPIVGRLHYVEKHHKGSVGDWAKYMEDKTLK